ncbi:Protein Y55F3C.10 [Aphelenchoides avenae]|nr:Protein Y55F3C.10 [Aphelenchus avenae]
MDVYWFRPEEYKRLYNCSAYKVDDVPLEQRQHVVIGYCFLAFFTLFETLYIPCFFAIAKHVKQSCYKFMLYISVVDLSCMCINGFFTGLFAVNGDVFCSHPDLIYILGMLGLVFWIAESTTAIMLAVSRCLEMCSPSWGRMLLEGKRTWFWMVPPTLYAAYYGIWTKPVTFTGLYIAWFFNPHVGYLEDPNGTYHNGLHSIHNMIVLFGLTGTYTTFSILIYMRTMAIDATKQRSSSQRMTFLQVLLISAVNATAAAIYVYMQYFPVSFTLIVVAQFGWLFAHGMPSVIYLTMNRTLRNDVHKMLAKVTTKNRVTTVVLSATDGSHNASDDGI